MARAAAAAALPGARRLAAQPQPPARAADAPAAVAGTVVRAGTRTPVEGAQILVGGTTVGATTDAAGRFRLRGVPADAAGQATLRVRRLGFQSFTQRVRVGAADLRLVLTEATVNLDAVVVTGTAGGQQQRTVPNVVSRIDAAAEVGRTGVTSVGQLLNGRAPGVIVVPSTGRAGAGPDINIRGRSTISLNQQPLLYIDGVRVTNDVGTGTRQQGGAVASRFNDIPPEDIESIEIIKGPAAATIYGTEAANCVIQIITKRGQAGERPQWNAALRHGTVAFQNPGGRIQTNYAQDSTGQLLSWNGVQQAGGRARRPDLPHRAAADLPAQPVRRLAGRPVLRLGRLRPEHRHRAQQQRTPLQRAPEPLGDAEQQGRRVREPRRDLGAHRPRVGLRVERAVLDPLRDADLRGHAPARLLRRPARDDAAAAERQREQRRAAGARPSLPLDRYAGTYADSTFGTVTVTARGGRLRLAYGPRRSGDLEPWEYDTFRARWTDPLEEPSLVVFQPDGAGGVASVRAFDVLFTRPAAPPSPPAP